jgi:hypothetical protein
MEDCALLRNEEIDYQERHMDITTVITIASIVLANIGTTILLFCWATNHASEDRRASDARVEAILTSIRDEMKDFHGRLCAIEERRRI